MVSGNKQVGEYEYYDTKCFNLKYLKVENKFKIYMNTMHLSIIYIYIN